VHGDLTFRGETTNFERSTWGLDMLVPFLGDRIDLTIETQLVADKS